MKISLQSIILPICLKKGKEEKTIQKPEWKSIIDSIEKTFDSIIDEYNNSIQIMRIAKNIPLIF